MVGRTLGRPATCGTNTQKALVDDPRTRIAISDRPYFVPGRRTGEGGGGPVGPRNNLAPDAQLRDFFVKTLGKEDNRRPRMDMGLGVWTGKTSRYYPMSLIRDRGGAFIDRLEGRNALIYIDPETNSPAAMFVNAARADLQDRAVRLDDGSILRSGVLSNRNGQRRRGNFLNRFSRDGRICVDFPRMRSVRSVRVVQLYRSRRLPSSRPGALHHKHGLPYHLALRQVTQSGHHFLQLVPRAHVRPDPPRRVHRLQRLLRLRRIFRMPAHIRPQCTPTIEISLSKNTIRLNRRDASAGEADHQQPALRGDAFGGRSNTSPPTGS